VSEGGSEPAGGDKFFKLGDTEEDLSSTGLGSFGVGIAFRVMLPVYLKGSWFCCDGDIWGMSSGSSGDTCAAGSGDEAGDKGETIESTMGVLISSF
jgi:hypothetical protein